MEWRLSLCVLFLAGFRLGCSAPNIVLILADDLDLVLQGLVSFARLEASRDPKILFHFAEAAGEAAEAADRQGGRV